MYIINYGYGMKFPFTLCVQEKFFSQKKSDHNTQEHDQHDRDRDSQYDQYDCHTKHYMSRGHTHGEDGTVSQRE